MQSVNSLNVYLSCFQFMSTWMDQKWRKCVFHNEYINICNSMFTNNFSTHAEAYLGNLSRIHVDRAALTHRTVISFFIYLEMEMVPFIIHFTHSCISEQEQNHSGSGGKLSNRQRSEQQLRFVLSFAEARSWRNVNPREDLLWFHWRHICF